MIEIYPLQDQDRIKEWQQIRTDNPKTTFDANELFKLCSRKDVADIGFDVEDIQYKLDRCQYIFILRVDGTTKGFAIVRVTGYDIFVEYLCTEVNKQGYGTTLLNAIKESAAPTGKNIQLVATQHSRNFYLKNGFVETDRENLMKYSTPSVETKGGKSRKRKTRRRKTFRLSRRKY